MSWLFGVFASILLFLGSLFGVSNSPHTSVNQPAPKKSPITGTTTNTLLSQRINPDEQRPSAENPATYTWIPIAQLRIITMDSGGHLPMQVYVLPGQRPPSPATKYNIPLATFEIKSGVIYDVEPQVDKPVNKADLASFEVLISSWSGTSFREAIARDKTHVFFGTSIIPGADPSSFSELNTSDGFPSDFYYKDQNHVYYDDPGVYDSLPIQPVTGADPNTFMVVLPYADEAYFPYAKDQNHVYYGSSMITGANPSTFSAFSSFDSYAKDKNHVYDSGVLIAGADPNSFKILNALYAKDKNSVYYNDSLLTGADTLTFTLNTTSDKTYDAQDKDHKYLNGQIVL